MKVSRVALIGLTLTALMVPLTSAIWFIGPTNFIATHGGIVRFSQNFQAYRLTYPDGLNRFTTLIWGTWTRGNVGFDADTGVNMTVTLVGAYRITYTVETAAPGAVNTYVYYQRSGPGSAFATPTVTGGVGTYNAGTHILTVATTGSPVAVTVTYGADFGGTAGIGIDMLIQFFPFVTLLVVIQARRLDLIDNKAMTMGILIAALGILLWAIRAAGY